MKVQQALHGYANGHAQLACSAKLSSRDAKMILVLSDVAVAGASLPGGGYLTGYPLTESGLYALARTWPAPEMPRPGCVWTHTLLIDLADLATLITPSALLPYFQRPTTLHKEYNVPIRVENQSASNIESLDPVNRKWAAEVIYALYDRPTDRIVASQPLSSAFETVILAVWGQQWPRLRRSFRFCTHSVADRSVEGAPFDLQVLPPNDRTARPRFPGALDADRLDHSDAAWVDVGVDALFDPTSDRLRGFLRRAGGDVTSGRQAFAPLCELYSLVEQFPTRASAIEEALQLVERKLAPLHAATAQAIVIENALGRVRSLSDSALKTFIQHLDILGMNQLVGHREEVGRALWSRDPLILATLSGTGEGGKGLLDETLRALPATEVIAGLEKATALIPSALKSRQELVEEPSFWELPGIPVGSAVEVASEDRGRLRRAVSAAFGAGRMDATAELLRRMEGQDPLDMMLGLLANGADPELIQPLLGYAAQRSWVVAEYLGEGKAHSLTALTLIARATRPDSVPNDVGDDPWVVALHGIDEDGDRSDSLYLRAYLLSRAFGHRSRSVGELAVYTFESVYTATRDDQLPDDSWNLLEGRLPSSWRWPDWDRCLRLRHGVINLFLDRELSAAYFCNLSSGVPLFAELVAVASERGRGRDYLRRVRGYLRGQEDELANRQLEIIEDQL